MEKGKSGGIITLLCIQLDLKNGNVVVVLFLWSSWPSHVKLSLLNCTEPIIKYISCC